uniref:C-C motif chemokine 13-like n=1 Tax=Takifugu rubripes TaxID=31033 RepID=A0A3B5K317_TAKRU
MQTRARRSSAAAREAMSLALVCIEFAAAEVVLDCCKTKTSKFFPLQRIQSYRIQDSGTGCDIDATVFVTKNGRHLCVSHPSEEKWVKKHIDALEKRKQKQAEVQVE